MTDVVAETVNWRSVAEELPDDETTVLVALKTGPTVSEPVWLGWYDSKDAAWFSIEGEELSDGQVLAWADMLTGPAPRGDRLAAINLATAINCHQELMEALRKIALGEGYYGLQAREYKDIAKAAIASVTMIRNSIAKQHRDV